MSSFVLIDSISLWHIQCLRWNSELRFLGRICLQMRLARLLLCNNFYSIQGDEEEKASVIDGWAVQSDWCSSATGKDSLIKAPAGPHTARTWYIHSTCRPAYTRRIVFCRWEWQFHFVFSFFFSRALESALLDSQKLFFSSNLFFCCARLNLFFK